MSLCRRRYSNVSDVFVMGSGTSSAGISDFMLNNTGAPCNEIFQYKIWYEHLDNSSAPPVACSRCDHIVAFVFALWTIDCRFAVVSSE